MKRFHLAVAVVVLMGASSSGFAQYESLGRGRLAGLLSDAAVQKEVKLTEEQKQQIKSFGDDRNRDLRRGLSNPNLEERQKAIDELDRRKDEYVESVLDEEQNKRLDEISLQRDGGMSLTREEVAEKLDLSDVQKDKIKKIHEEYTSANIRRANERARRQRYGFSQKGFAEGFEFYRKTNADLLAVLTPAQSEAFEKMKGEKFEYSQESPPPSPAPEESGGLEVEITIKFKIQKR
jgi:Spy/CpxP family protein refolding chaperone